MEFCLGFLWGVRVPSLKLTQPTKIPIEIMVNIFKMVDVPWRFVRFPGGSTGRIGVFFSSNEKLFDVENYVPPGTPRPTSIFNGCFNWTWMMIPNHYIKNGWKSPFPSIEKNGCLGY